VNRSALADGYVSGPDMSLAGLNGATVVSCKQAGRHLVLQPLAGREQPDLVAHEGEGASERSARVAGHVRAD